MDVLRGVPRMANALDAPPTGTGTSPPKRRGVAKGERGLVTPRLPSSEEEGPVEYGSVIEEGEAVKVETRNRAPYLARQMSTVEAPAPRVCRMTP